MGLYTTTTTLSLVMVGTNFSATNMTTLGSKAIDQAEAEVNKYLSKRYDLSSSTFQTSTSIPPLVRAMTERLSEANMWEFLSRGGTAKETLERAKQIKIEVIGSEKNPGNLMLIAQHKMDLTDSTGSVINDFSNTSQRIRCNTSSYTPTFDEDSPLNWAVDADKEN